MKKVLIVSLILSACSSVSRSDDWDKCLERQTKACIDFVNMGSGHLILTQNDYNEWWDTYIVALDVAGEPIAEKWWQSITSSKIRVSDMEYFISHVINQTVEPYVCSDPKRFEMFREAALSGNPSSMFYGVSVFDKQHMSIPAGTCQGWFENIRRFLREQPVAFSKDDQRGLEAEARWHKMVEISEEEEKRAPLREKYVYSMTQKRIDESKDSEYNKLLDEQEQCKVRRDERILNEPFVMTRRTPAHIESQPSELKMQYEQALVQYEQDLAEWKKRHEPYDEWAKEYLQRLPSHCFRSNSHTSSSAQDSQWQADARQEDLAKGLAIGTSYDRQKQAQLFLGSSSSSADIPEECMIPSEEDWLKDRPENVSSMGKAFQRPRPIPPKPPTKLELDQEIENLKTDEDLTPEEEYRRCHSTKSSRMSDIFREEMAKTRRHLDESNSWPEDLRPLSIEDLR